MKADKYLQALTKRIESSRIRKDIMREYQDHIEDCKEALMESGMSEEEAEEEAVRQMGDPGEAGREMNRIYRDVLDLNMAIWFLACCVLTLLTRWVLERGMGVVDISAAGVPVIIPEYIGRALLVYGFLLSAWEKHNDLELYYVHGKDWGGAGAGAMNNSGFILAVGVALMAHSMERGVWISIIAAAAQIVLRSYIQTLNNKREMELLWEIGVADTAITYKGKGTFRGKQIKIKTNEEEIQPGTSVMIVMFEGPKPVVARV